MGKILFFLVLLGLVFIYYFKPVSIDEPQKEQPVQQEEKKETPKPIVKKVKPQLEQPKQEQQPQEEEPILIIDVDQTPIEKPLPELSTIITSGKNHPYADPDKYPLHYAICKGDLEQVKKVLKRESLANEQGEVVIGTKECYCQENQYEICRCPATLIMPPLNLAVLQRNEDIVKYLLKRKANPLGKDALGRNSLDIAQKQNMAPMMDLLAKYAK